jgi:hypothetical protein
MPFPFLATASSWPRRSFRRPAACSPIRRDGDPLGCHAQLHHLLHLGWHAPTTNSILYRPFVLTTSASVQAIAAEFGAVNSGVASAGSWTASAVGNGAGLQGQYWSNTTSVAFTNTVLFRLADAGSDRCRWSISTGAAQCPPASIGQTNFVVRWTRLRAARIQRDLHLHHHHRGAACAFGSTASC